jgi:Zn-finger nucleic acid-binding protein
MCDSSEMLSQTIEGVEIDRCPSCRGIWLDANELEKLLEADPRELLQEDRTSEADRQDSGRRLQCPRCEGTQLIKLNSRLRPGTILDSCTVCYGTWLDAGELTRLAGTDLVGRLRRLLLG